MIGQVFQYIVVRTEKNDEGKEIKSSVIVAGNILSKDVNAALFAIGAKLEQEAIEELEVLIRPF